MAPAKYTPGFDNLLFLSGSVEAGPAGDWRSKVIRALEDKVGTILNPQRDDWDDTWVQSIHDERFREQVVWELDGLSAATHIVYYFAPGTKAPVTMLELGLNIGANAYVCCPEGFWRKGNVDIVVHEFAINTTVYEDLDMLLIALREDL